MADWQKNDDGTFTYYGYGRRITDDKLKEIMSDLILGVTIREVAKDRRLPIPAVREIFTFFNKMIDD